MRQILVKNPMIIRPNTLLSTKAERASRYVAEGLSPDLRTDSIGDLETCDHTLTFLALH